MARKQKVFNILSKIAEDTQMTAKLAAAIVYKNEIISIGINQLKSHPIQAKYSSNEKKIYIHAEIDAIVKALKRIDSRKLKNCSLYVARVKRDGANCIVPGLAKPCPDCWRAITAFGIKNVYWSENELKIST